MKRSPTYISAFCALTLSAGSLSTSVRAQAPASEHGHEHSTKVPDGVADIFKAVDKNLDRLTKSVAAKNLDDAHDYGFALRDLAAALVAKVPEAKKKDVEAAAKKISELATSIDKSSAAGAQKTTESSVKAMSNAVKALKTAAGYTG